MISRSEYPFLSPANSIPDYDLILSTPPIEIEKIVKDGLERAMCLINGILSDPPQPATYQNALLPFELIFDFVHQLHQPIDHLVMVCESDELSQLQLNIDEVISKFNTDFFQNEKAYNLIKNIGDNDVIKKHWIESFEHTGIQLSKTDKEKFKANNVRLSELQNKFGTNVVKSRKQFMWEAALSDLSGLTNEDLGLLNTNAINLNVDTQYLITLDAPCANAILSRCDIRETRERVYQALTTIASDGEFDNTSIMDEIIDIRAHQASLLGFPTYAELSTSDKMAKSARTVLDFLNSFGDIKPAAAREVSELHDFAVTHLGIYSIDQTNRFYVAEKMQQYLYHFSSSQVSQYFPTEQTVNKTMDVFGDLYGIEFKPPSIYIVWHPDVIMFDLFDKSTKNKIGSLYVDLYARQGKTGGAWMDSVTSRHIAHGETTPTLPVAVVVCNFAPHSEENPSLMMHRDLETLFHEMGHAMHHLLTEQDSLTISGINGVQWDAVELPSQIMENWCWDKDTITKLSSHYQTGEQFPDDLFEKMDHASTFCGALELVKRLEQSTFDMFIHMDHSRTIYENLERAREKYNPLDFPEYNKFAHAFIHIFQAGYAAGYYGYLWADGLSCDAFELFEQEGVNNPLIADKFRRTILAVGSSVDMAEAFESFRGRPSSVKALLKRNGVVDTTTIV